MTKRLTVIFSVGLLTVGLWTAWGYSLTYHRYFTEWNFFELGGNSLFNVHHQAAYGGGGLHLYVTNPQLQIGPLAFLLISPFEWLRWTTVATIFVVVMTVMGIVALIAATKVGREVSGRRASTIGWPLAAGGIVAAGIWGYDCSTWRHLDDAIGLMLTAIAMVLIHRGKKWWVIGLLLGTAAATKPWAVILVPIILAMPRRDIARTGLVVLASIFAWWAPFIIAAPKTTSALGQYIVTSNPGSVLYLIGFRGPVEGWLRPTQFVVGGAICALVVYRGRWTAAPFAALAFRVLTDPYSYAYYGLGPLLFAYLYDCSGDSGTDLPVFTAVTAIVEFLLPPMRLGNLTIAAIKLVWGLGVLGFIIARRRPVSEESTELPAATARLSARPSLVS